jgi:hypothetical protein
MKTNLIKLICGLAVLGIVSQAAAQGTVTITGTGSGTVDGSPFSNSSFIWTLTYSTNSPYTGFGANSTVYTTLTSQISLQAFNNPTLNVTGSPGMWINNANPNSFSLAPMAGIPGANILTITGTPGWNGVNAFTSQANPTSAFNQFVNIATSAGDLTMSSGSVSQVTIAGIAPVPEPSTIALAGIGGVSALVMFRRRK